MTDQERREEEALKKCIEEAYGCTDDELFAELEEIEATLSDSDFPGIEDRAYQKLMKRIAEEEEAKTAEAAIVKAVEMPAEAKTESGAAETGEKVVRIGKKKVLMVAVLSATFAGLLGITAIGGKSYFFKEQESSRKIVFDNGKNIEDASKLEEAYEEAENVFGNKILRLNYVPEEMKFQEIFIEKDKVEICFDYNGNIVRYVQIKKKTETSIGVESDRKDYEVVKNDWLNKEIRYSENVLTDGSLEYESRIIENDMMYLLAGKMEKDIFIEIIKNLFF